MKTVHPPAGGSVGGVWRLVLHDMRLSTACQTAAVMKWAAEAAILQQLWRSGLQRQLLKSNLFWLSRPSCQRTVSSCSHHDTLILTRLGRPVTRSGRGPWRVCCKCVRSGWFRAFRPSWAGLQAGVRTLESPPAPALRTFDSSTGLTTRYIVDPTLPILLNWSINCFFGYA